METLFANLRKQSSDPSGSNVDASHASDSQFNQQQFHQNLSRASSHGGSSIPTSFNFGALGKATPQSTAYRPASVSSPIESPIPFGRQPRHGSDVISPDVSTPSISSPAPNAGQGGSDRAAHLLNLLKFAQPSSKPSTPSATAVPQLPTDTSASRELDGGAQDPSLQDNQKSQGQSISASDLVASIMAKTGTPGARASPSPSTGPPKTDTPHEATEQTTPATAQAQDLLMKLLSKSKPSQSVSPSARPAPASHVSSRKASETSLVMDHLSRDLAGTSLQKEASTVKGDRVERSTRSNSSTSHRPDRPARKPSSPTESRLPLAKGLQSGYRHVTPFERVAAASQESTPPSEPARTNAPPTFNILKRPGTATSEQLGSDSHKRKSKESSPGSEHASSRRRLASSNDGLSSARSSPRPAPPTVTRDQASASKGLATADKNIETVSEALKEVAEEVDRQVEDALAKVNGKTDSETKREPHPGNGQVKEIQARLVAATTELTKGLDQAKEKPTSGETTSAPIANAIQEIDDQIAEEGIVDSWESADAEDSPAKEEEGEGRTIKVYVFPMKPFSSLALKPAPEHVMATIPRESILDIARLKKDFDQMDRTLVTASKHYITYAIMKHGGLRVIRQDDGQDKQIFRNSEDRIVNVVSSVGPPGQPSFDGEAVFGTGVSGSVYWVSLPGMDQDFWTEKNPESHGFIFPPISAQEDNVSGQRTRAKKSARHPEFFAIGRGKAIYIIWPSVARHQQFLIQRKGYRTVDAERYLRGRCLKITTGKAGKDFVFSEDDTTIASVDKTGRLGLWDIRKLTDPVNGEVRDTGVSKIAPIEINMPLMALRITPPQEKACPSSVLFVDKHKPVTKGVASRYLVVGLKQNHTLQLWDLALGRPVQEVHFPHENEEDAICSISYHSSSGIIIVGHPTRNSIYFLTLSLPRYNHPSISQATYIERLVQKDPSLVKPDATAILTGVREYSFPSIGQLRSIDVPSQPSSVSDDGESPVLFEIYAMHSKGVCCISIRAEDLGWSKESKVLHPMDAVMEGLVTIASLPPPPALSATEQTGPERAAGTTTASNTTPKAAIKDTAKQNVSVAAAQDRSGALPTLKELPDTAVFGPQEHKTERARGLMSNGAHEAGGNTVEKVEKKKKKRAGVADISWRAKDDRAAPATSSTAPVPYDQSSQRLKCPGSPTKSKDDAALQDAKGKSATVNAAQTSPTKARPGTPTFLEAPSSKNGTSGDAFQKEVEKMGKTVSAEFNKVMSAELGKLYHRIDEDRRIHQAAFDTKLEAVLRLVSSILTENTEKALARIVEQNITKSVLPAVKETTLKALDRQFGEHFRDQIHHTVSQDLRKILPGTIGQALESPNTVRIMSDLVANKVATHVESEFAAVVHGTLSPVFKEFTLNTVQRMAEGVERRVADQIDRLEARHRADSEKIDNLQDLSRGLAQMVSKMAGVQADFQQEILRLQRQVMQTEARQDGGSSRSRSHQQGTTPVYPTVNPFGPVPAPSAQQPVFAQQDVAPRGPSQNAPVQSTPAPSSHAQSSYGEPTPTRSSYRELGPIQRPTQPSSGRSATGRSNQTLPANMTTPLRDLEQIEIDEITTMMREGRYEDATVKVRRTVVDRGIYY